jgi:hypothetical protein
MAEVTLKPENPKKAFLKLFKGFPDKFVEQALKDAQTTIKAKIQGNTPIGITKTSGNLHKGWSNIKKVSGGFSFQNRTPYAEVLELGSYKGIGPRTQSGSRKGQFGIFSQQAGGGILQPIVEDQVFVDNLVNFVANEILKQLREGAGLLGRT